MLYLILLLNEHRLLVMWVVAFMTWCAAYGLYLRNYIRLWFSRGQRHSWSVDMATKKVVRQGKEEVY